MPPTSGESLSNDEWAFKESLFASHCMHRVINLEPLAFGVVKVTQMFLKFVSVSNALFDGSNPLWLSLSILFNLMNLRGGDSWSEYVDGYPGKSLLDTT